MIFDDGQIQCIKRCELSTVIITIHGPWVLGGCICSLDSLLGAIPMLTFPVCGYDENFSVFNTVSLKMNLCDSEACCQINDIALTSCAEGNLFPFHYI